MNIAKSEFRPSIKGMLGPGAYFARSTQATYAKIGKPEQTGAWFVAKIRMKNVYVVDLEQIREEVNSPRFDPEVKKYVKSGEWRQKYDTCYFQHTDAKSDEFCIKNPEDQIIEWVVVIEGRHDKKLSSYKLDEEFKDILCCCI